MPSDPTPSDELATLPSGLVVRIRPIRTEDAPLLIDLVARTAPEDRRMRFFAAMGGLSPDAAARLARTDDDREVALIAQPSDHDEILGVARYSAEPDRRTAEFAVLVRSDWKAHGVGWLLMERLVAAARLRGVGRLTGIVLRENHDMLRFCRDLGFTIVGDTADPATVCAELDLSAPAVAP